MMQVHKAGGLAIALVLVCVSGACWAQTAQDSMKPPSLSVHTRSEQSVTAAPDEHFTGNVQVRALFGVLPPSRLSGGEVTFSPGARSAWHTHPLGQTLLVTAGEGWIQQWGGPVQVIRAGDVVVIPPGVKHWHGATASSSMTHTALQEELDGQNVRWLEKVSAEQYHQPR